MILTSPTTKPASRQRLIPGLPYHSGDLLTGRYRLESRARTAGACAYLVAVRSGSQVRVDVQLLIPKDDKTDEARLRFLAEARKVAKLESPHVARVIEVGVTGDGHPFVVREPLPGRSLSAVLREVGSLPTEQAVDVALAICDVLAEAHPRGLVHGEIDTRVVHIPPPEGPGKITLSELGTARPLALLSGAAGPGDTLTIRAPESTKPDAEDGPRADIWGVGVVLYTMLAGEPPFSAATPSTLDLSVVQEEQALLAGIPDALAELVDQCLSKDPERRPKTARDLAERLAPFGSPAPAPLPQFPIDLSSGRDVGDKEVENAADNTPEPSVVSTSIAPTVVSTSAQPSRARDVTPAATTYSRSWRATGLITAAACLVAGIAIGAQFSPFASQEPVSGRPAADQAPPAAAAAPAPPVETAEIPSVHRAALPEPPEALEPPAPMTTAPEARPVLPVAKPASVVASPKVAAPESVDPLVRAAAVPNKPEPKASDDDLRQFLDDRR